MGTILSYSLAVLIQYGYGNETNPHIVKATIWLIGPWEIWIQF